MNDGDKEEKNKKVEFGFPKEGIIDDIDGEFDTMWHFVQGDSWPP